MSYLQLRFLTPRERADELSSVLDEQGALSVSWENAGEDASFDAALPREPEWRRVYVTGLFDAACSTEAVVRAVNRRLHEDLVPQVRSLDDEDWERAWLARFEPRRYRGDLWVCPSWTEPPDPQATNLVIDPGLAFGTGDHPTTAMCLDWISERDWSGSSIIDYGCGSGILAIACLLKGASRAVGVDIDPRALSVSAANAAANGVSDRYEGLAPEALPDRLDADLVIANILSGVLIELAGVLAARTRSGGRLLLTGILEDHAAGVRRVFEPAFELESQFRDGWCLLIGGKR